MNTRILALLLIAILATGCGIFDKEPEVKGVLTAELPTPDIKSGENTVLHVNGLNSGGTELSVGFIIQPNNPEFVTIRYPGELNYVIRPQETTGRKVITVTATTEAQRSDYAIDIILKDLKTDEDLDKKTVVLTVTK